MQLNYGNDDGDLLVKIEVISDDGRETFSDQEAAAKFAAGLNVAGVNCDTVFHFSDGTTATIRQKCDSEGVTSKSSFRSGGDPHNPISVELT